MSHDNTWIGLNDRTVEEDFQWTDNMDLVSTQMMPSARLSGSLFKTKIQYYSLELN